MEKRKRLAENCIRVPGINPDKCLECGQPTTNWHHFVPHSLGGNMMIPLCDNCNNLCHDKDLMSMASLAKEGRKRARERGESSERQSEQPPELITKAEDLYKDGHSKRTIAKMFIADGTWKMPYGHEGKYVQSKRNAKGKRYIEPEARWLKTMETRVNGMLVSGLRVRKRAVRKIKHELLELAAKGQPASAWIPDDTTIVKGQNLPNLFNEGL